MNTGPSKILYFYSTTETKKCWSFCSTEERSRLILNKTAERAVPCSTLVILGMSALKRKNIHSFNLECECLLDILIRLSAINIVDYIFLSTKCFHRWRWIATLQLNLISYMLIRNIQGQHHIWNVKSTCKLTWFWTSNARISSHCIKRRDVYHFS